MNAHLTSEDLIKIAQEVKIIRSRLDVIDRVVLESTLKRRENDIKCDTENQS